MAQKKYIRLFYIINIMSDELDVLRIDNLKLKEENELLKQQLKKYTNPDTVKRYYQKNREKEIKRVREYQKKKKEQLKTI
jgi:hypothetical protein